MALSTLRGISDWDAAVLAPFVGKLQRLRPSKNVGPIKALIKEMADTIVDTEGRNPSTSLPEASAFLPEASAPLAQASAFPIWQVDPLCGGIPPRVNALRTLLDALDEACTFTPALHSSLRLFARACTHVRHRRASTSRRRRSLCSTKCSCASQGSTSA